ncbi:S8 family serine peptidase [Desulfospira joergensenii]|uniref:S8 family serine peptidase n=1 Tax=Desulfospira joergensenii TaxID=53329 RepID=UPI0003B3CC30|nr:S8 family serine peptidase [Desulfospira joergensenii]
MKSHYCRFILCVVLINALAACAVIKPDPFRIQIGDRKFTPKEMDSTAIALELGKIDASHANILLQVDHIPTLRQRRTLEDLGIRLETPLSGHAWLASVPTSLTAEQIESIPLRWVGFLDNRDKLAPSLKKKTTGAYAGREPGRIELMVKLFQEADFNGVARQLEKLGGKILRDAGENLGVIVVSVPEGKLDSVAAINAVRYVDPALGPGLPESDRARSFIGADPVQAAGIEGTGVTVGVFEYEHIYAAHPDFGGRALKGDGGPTYPDEGFAHPTMTAGMIAGDGSLAAANGGTPLQWRGMAPDAFISFYAYQDPVDSVTNYMDDVQDAVVNDGIDMANNSWGDSGCADFAYGAYAGRAPFLDNIVHGSLGRKIPIIFSAGNERRGIWDSDLEDYTYDCLANTASPFENYGSLNHPKSAKNILAVGAVDSDNDKMSDYSSWGPTLDGRIKPEVVASGHHNGADDGNITFIDNPYGREVDAWGNETYGNPSQQDFRVPYRFNPADPDDFRYGWYGQTSSAAAQVSGGYALILDAWREQFPGRADPLPSTYKALVVHTARDLDNATSWYNPGPDYASGFGVVDVDAAITSVQRREALENQVDHGGSETYYLAVAAGTPSLKITLAWDDPAAADGADPALINDLDLVVTAPDGTRHYPWTLDPASPSADAQQNQADRVNNLEQVAVDAPVQGTWEVSIAGHSVPEGPQPFSLVADNGPVRRPLDLILALDISDSMNSAPPGGGPVATKIELLRQAVEIFLETWSLHAITDDKIGVVYFSTDLSGIPGAPSVLLDLDAHLLNIIDHVGIVGASGCTAMGAALQEAFDSFDPLGNNKRAIVLFSDGMQSINPFVGEEGTPSRLKIKDYGSGETLPFGAFRCDPGTALTIGGIPSSPDGEFIDEHDVQIHTIGTGVSGAGFEELIERIAVETNGAFHFTSTPDAELDLFYTDDLVQSLKANTLEIVKTDAGNLAGGKTHLIRFPVNETAKNLTLVLSWKGKMQENAVSIHAATPGKNQAVAAEIRNGKHYTVMRFDRALDPGDFTGEWMVQLENTTSRTLGFQQSVIVDEEDCFSYAFAHDTGMQYAGGKIHLTARLSEYGRPFAEAKAVSVSVSAPALSRGNLLAEWLPRAQIKMPKLKFPLPLKFKPYRIETNAVIEKRLRQLGNDPEFTELLNRRKTWSIQLLDNGNVENGDWLAGDGIYSAFMENTMVAGDYHLSYQLGAESNCGSVSRSQNASLVIQAGEFDPDRSEIKFQRILEGAVIQVRPADKFGNLLGPGQAHKVNIQVEGGKPMGSVIDHLDGTYEQRIIIRKDIDPRISIEIGGGGRGKLINSQFFKIFEMK